MSDSKKKFSFFKEADEVDPQKDGGQLLGTWRKRSEYDHTYSHNWNEIDRAVYGDKDDLFTFIYGDEYYKEDEDEVNITYKKNSNSKFWADKREEYPDFFIDHRLECRMTDTMGRGIFATEDIEENILIESAPVILCHRNILQEVVHIHGKVSLSEYPFGWGKNGLMAISMGWGGIYNHSPRPNVKWLPNYDIESIEYRTVKPVKKGDQLFVRYLPVHQLENRWFEDAASEEIVEQRENMEWKEDPGTFNSWAMWKPGTKNRKR